MGLKCNDHAMTPILVEDVVVDAYELFVARAIQGTSLAI